MSTIQIERHKLLFDLMKHLTTLSTGSALLVITLVEKMFPTPEWVWLVALSVICFLVSLLASLLVMGVLASNVGRHVLDADDQTLFMLGSVTSVVAFFLGVMWIACFSLVNFF